MEKLFLNWEETCEVLGIGRSRLYDLALNQHEIISVKLGKSRRFSAASVRDFADRKIQESQGSADELRAQAVAAHTGESS